MNWAAFPANAFDGIRMLADPRVVSRAAPVAAVTIAGDALDFAGILVSAGDDRALATGKLALR
ncbi:MAG: hypothetical protein ACM3N6_15025 [Betaproteobacteria bacterium]